MELREEATLNDALDVIDIVKSSLIDTLSDEFGTMNFDRSQNGCGMSSRNQV
jgi:DNA helicase MCM8